MPQLNRAWKLRLRLTLLLSTAMNLAAVVGCHTLSAAAAPTKTASDSDQLNAAKIAAQGATTVAWIAGTFGLLGAIVGAVGARQGARQKRQAEKLEAGIQESGKHLASGLIDRFGLKVQSASIVAEILNDQGDAVITRTIRGFQIVKDNITIGAIPLKVKADAPQAKLLSDLTVEATVGGVGGGGAYPKDVRPRQVQLTENDKSLSAMLEVTGTLSRFDPPLDLVCRWSVNSGYVMSGQAYSQGFPYEYHSWTPDLPTEVLEIEIRFPEHYRAQPFAGVFLGGTETMHNAELNQIQSGLEKRPHGARLHVEEPLLGLSYLIYWKGP